MADAITTKNITSVDEVQSVDNTDKVFVNDNGSFKQISVSNLMKQAPSGVTEETDPTVSEWAKQPTKPSYTANEVGALPVGTKIPTKTSDLTNDSGYLTQIPEEYVTETELGQKGYVIEDDIPEKLPSPGTLTFTGAVNDTYDGSTNKTINIPTGGGEGGTSDYNALANKPTLNGVEIAGNKTSTDYKIVSSEQGIENNGKFLGVGVDGNVTPVDKPTYTAGEVGARPDTWTPSAEDVGALPNNTEIPSKTSDLENDSGFITNSDIPEKLPNPQKIIFTGAVSAEYDGSSQQTINIPTDGGSEPYTLPIMSDTHLGGGKAVSKTDEDVPVAVDPLTGQLFVPTYPENTGGGGGTVDPEQIKQAVNGYLEENPPSGMTAEQEQQLEQNTTDVADLKDALPDKLDTNQGSDNAGKYLTVGDDGNITTSDALIDDGVSLPTGGTTGQVLTKRSNTDNDVVWRSGISGKNEDDNSDYNIVTKIKDGNLIATLEYTSHSPSPGGDDLDVVAINGKTYREIFIDGNKIQWGDFENGSERFEITSGTPTLSEEECVSRTHSLKAFGEISQQYRIANAYSHTNSTSVYIALKAKCDRHIKGTLGFTNGNVTVGASDRTNGFETYSVIDTKPGIKGCFIGSISSANLDGYVDDIVVINITEIFGDSVPEKEMLDNAYNNYISIITSDSDDIPSVASISKTEEYILSSDRHIEYTDTECISAFMNLVNRKAEYYGMANSNFISPSGAGGNISCAKDLAIAGYYACGYRNILDVWKHKQYDVKVYGPNEREINVSSTVMNTPIGDYTVHGGKTGSWAGTENLLVVAEANNEVFICVVMDCGSSQNRFVAMGELLDVISSSSGEVSTALAACAYKIPTQIPQLHNISEETAIYTKNDTQEIIPASVTKVMTAITALDYADSLSEKILFKPSDLESGSGAIFQAGDIITLNDALVAMLLPSSNMAAKAVARNIGKKYLERFGK